MAGKNIKLEDLRIEDEVKGKIWNQVCSCENFGSALQDFLKAVEYGSRKYTSIDAYVQIRKATELFGPMGIGWGIRGIKLISITPVEKAVKSGVIVGNLAMFSGTFWFDYGEVDGVEISGQFEVMDDIFLDASGDSCKKVLTSMITKALSYLGWNYDVFRGRFNDVKTFEAAASDEEKAILNGMLAKVKKEVADGIRKYHDTRGWLRSDVQNDIKKIGEAMARKKGAGNAEPSGEEGGAGGSGADQDE